MIKDLELLLKLQDIDEQIHTLELSKKEYPREVEDLEKNLKEARDKVDAFEKKIVDIAAQEKAFETKIADAKIALKKSEDRLNSITTNREYDAVHAEIENHKHIISGGTGKLKSHDDEREHLKKSRIEANTLSETLVTEKQPRIDELKAKIASIDSDIAEVMKERVQIVSNIAAPILRSYENIHRKRKNGRTIGTVHETNRICRICYKVLEPQIINEIRRGTKLMICEACGSLLIWKEDEVTSED
jgi:predicted  nucleic acid-binding Zn-ribbon protein